MTTWSDERQNDTDDLRVIQRIVLDIAIEFAKACEKHNLCYSLFLGSLLGAVRHEGFIPWDDDMDFAMPRKDYERFIEIAEEELPGHLRLRVPGRDGYNRCVLRIEDTRTLLRLESYQEGNDLPIWLDIFALDGTPRVSPLRRIAYWRTLFKKGLWAISAFDEVVNLNRPNRPKYQQLIISVCKLFNPGRLLDTKSRIDGFDAEASRYSYENSEKVFCATTAYDYSSSQWEGIDYEILCPMRFEEHVFPGPVNYDRVLRTTYGEYMVLPPEHKRALHHFELIDYPAQYSVGVRNTALNV